jgi:hypothetical protein
MSDIEDRMAAIIKATYDTTGYEDEGRADQAAHEIMALLAELAVPIGYYSIGLRPTS